MAGGISNIDSYQKTFLFFLCSLFLRIRLALVFLRAEIIHFSLIEGFRTDWIPTETASSHGETCLRAIQSEGFPSSPRDSGQTEFLRRQPLLTERLVNEQSSRKDALRH